MLLIIQWNEKYIQGIRSDRVTEELWTEVRDIVQRGSDQDHPQEKEIPKDKMAVWRGLKNSYEKKRSESKAEKESCTHLNAEFQK